MVAGRRSSPTWRSIEAGAAEHAAAFEAHPALLDAVFHAVVGLPAVGGPDGRAALPFAFHGVRAARTAAALRVRIARVAPDTLRVGSVDETGALSGDGSDRYARRIRTRLGLRAT
ncbi:polyketide synthase dehydratase domain-containing protein [Streptomyces sp. NPDC047967]|uniref:polyketide synthase dehydratase domain-containing protein n=1 Tax=Streptomyces sp. NPDC047967 TaxID=3154924 RepID=UPI0034009183